MPHMLPACFWHVHCNISVKQGVTTHRQVARMLLPHAKNMQVVVTSLVLVALPGHAASASCCAPARMAHRPSWRLGLCWSCTWQLASHVQVHAHVMIGHGCKAAAVASDPVAVSMVWCAAHLRSSCLQLPCRNLLPWSMALLR